MADTEHGVLQQKVTRREFLKGSSAIAASLAASSSALAATNAPANSQALGESPLLLPPFLSRPTETSIRITARSRKPWAEAAIELRRDGKTNWERQPALERSSHELLDWAVNQLSPA